MTAISLVSVLLGVLLGLTLASALAFVVLPSRLATRFDSGRQSRQGEIDELRARANALQEELDLRQRESSADRQRIEAVHAQVRQLLAENGELRGAASRMQHLEETLREREQELTTSRRRLEAALTLAKGLETRLQDEIRNANEKLDFVGKLRGEFSDAFKNLASEVLDDRSQRLKADSEQHIGALLTPVREQLRQFQDAVQQAYFTESKERSLLAREIDGLKSLNQQLSTEALSLTRALRGDTRVQGAWGELILSRLLQAAGLTSGREYTEQAALKTEDGSRPRPDVIVHLPQERDLVIDAKVSLTAYERSTRAASEAERDQALDEHLTSIRRHVQNLSERDYASLLDGRALDFVLLFVPVESALIEAVRRDGGLYEFALTKNVAIVSPSTLLATLRAASHLWKLELRNRHAADIAKRAGSLYDKFVGFIDDLENARLSLSKAQSQLDGAYNKLKSGRGNLIRQADQLRSMGARSSKALPNEIVQEAIEFGGDEEG